MATLLERAREAVEGVTLGPWTAHQGGEDTCDGITDPSGDEIVTTDSGVYGPNWKDAQFIATARTLLPELADELGRVTVMRAKAPDDRLAEFEAEDRSWMTREDFEAHYVGAMANWHITLDERDELRAKLVEAEKRLAVAYDALHFITHVEDTRDPVIVSPGELRDIIRTQLTMCRTAASNAIAQIDAAAGEEAT